MKQAAKIPLDLDFHGRKKFVEVVGDVEPNLNLIGEYCSSAACFRFGESRSGNGSAESSRR